MDTSLLLFQGNRTNLQMGLPHPSTAAFAKFKQSHSNIHTHICCKGALSDLLGIRVGIEFEDVVWRCCLCGGWHLHSFALDSMRWALCQEDVPVLFNMEIISTNLVSQLQQTHCIQISSEPITETPKKSQSIHGSGTKNNTQAFTRVAHMLAVFLFHMFSTERIQDCTTKSRPSQLQQTHCIQISSEPISENAEEITIDPWKWNKTQHASFHMSCAHARGVSRIFFSTERIQDCTTHCIKRCLHSETWPVLSIANQFQ